MKKFNILKYLLPGRLVRKIPPEKRVYFYIGIGALIIVLSPLVLGELFFPKGSKAAWFDENYLYRQVANITNSNSTALTDFQVALTVDTATLISAGKMRADCNDIRITDQGGNLLPFWVEEGSADCNSASTKIWTKAPTIATSGASLFFYYGNQQAASQSSGLTTFDFFDDFNKGQLDNSKWGATDTVSFSGGGIDIATGSVYTKNSVFSEPGQKVEGKLRWTNSSGSYSGISISNANNIATGNSNGNRVSIYSRASDLTSVRAYSSSSGTGYNVVSDVQQFSSSNSTDYVMSQAVSSTNVLYYRNRSLLNSYSGTWTANHYLILGYFTGSIASTTDIQDISIDWVLSRKYAATEPTTAFGTEEKSPSPVAYWAFDEGTGNVASSSASPKLPAQLMNGPVWTPSGQCVAGQCLYFDGSNDYVNAGNNTAERIFGSSFTIGMWVRTGTATQWAGFFARSGSPGAQYLMSSTGSQRVEYNAGNSTFDSTTAITDNKWHFISVVYNTADSNRVTFYLDGRANGTTTGVSFAAGTTENYYIGAERTAAIFFKGYIDEVKVYPFALSAAQVKANYNARSGLNGQANVLGATQNSALSNGLVGYWKMDEASWSGAAGEVIDSSGNSNNGTSVAGANASPSAKFGNAGYFAGTDEYVTTPANWSNTFSNGLTISAWVNFPNFTNYNRVVAIENSAGTNYDTWLQANGTTAHVEVGSGIGRCKIGATALSANTWYHIVGVTDYTSGGTKVYVNGIDDGGTICATPTYTATKGTLDIGRLIASSTPNYGIGNIDEARIYNRALSPMEVAQLYNFAPGPVGYWNFEEGRGNVVNDSSTYGNNGVWSGTGSKWGVGKYGKGGSFNGVSDYVTVTSSIVSLGSQFTVSFWAKYDSSGGAGSKHLVDIRGGGTSVLAFRGGNSDVFVRSASGITPTGGQPSLVYDNGIWAFYTAVSDGVNVKIYKNGILQDSKVWGQVLDTSSTWSIGRSNSGLTNAYSGQIDEVKVYNYGRTPAQIISDMQAGAPPVTASGKNTIGYWKFDEGYGTSANNSGSQGVALRGTLTNMNSPAVATSGWTNDGKFSKALSFDGINDYVALSARANGTFPRSFSVWVINVPSSGRYEILNYEGTFFNVQDNKGCFYIDGANNLVGYLCSTASLVPGWNHIVATYNGSGTEAIYINGKASGTLSVATPGTGVFGDDRIGVCSYCGNADWFFGQIDDLKVYDYLITAQDVKAEYNHGSSLVLGSAGMNSSGVASNSAGAYYCVPGDTSQSCSPVGEWKFEEGKGSTVNDTSGNANTGTWAGTGATHFVPGKVGWGGNFNGTDNSVIVSDSTVFDGLANGGFSFWVKPTLVTTGSGVRATVINKNVGGANNGDVVCGFSQVVKYLCTFEDGSTSVTITSTNSLPLNKWSYISITWSNGSPNTTFTLYVNGVKDVTATLDGAVRPFQSGVNFTIANTDYTGQIDQVRLYNYSLSAAQIAWDYNYGKPVAQWRMDECQGSTVRDSSGNGNSGTIQIGASGTQTTVGTCQAVNTAAAWYNGRSGKFNYSLNFDGTDDYVDAGNGSSLNFTTGSFTLSGWIYPTGTGTRRTFIEKRNGTNNPFIRVEMFQDKVFCNLHDGSRYPNAQSTTTLVNNTWYHFACVLDTTGNTLKVYLNGIMQASSSTSGLATLTSASNWLLGKGNDSGKWVGQIDDVQIFNYPLTAVQVKNVYNQNSAVRFGPLTGSP